MHRTILTRDSAFQLEQRSTGSTSGDGLTLTGYAATFHDPTRIRSWEGDFEETIAPGAFAESLAERTPILQWNHGHDPTVGAVPIGAFVEIVEDERGLRVTARLHDNPTTLPVRQAIESGAVTGMSFRFEVTGEYWRDVNGKLLTDREVGDLLWSPGNRGPLQRTLTSVRLFEAGPVATPAYRNTSVGIRTSNHSADAELDALALRLLKGQTNA